MALGRQRVRVTRVSGFALSRNFAASYGLSASFYSPETEGKLLILRTKGMCPAALGFFFSLYLPQIYNLMTKEQIDAHSAMKRMNPSYPKLPKFILNRSNPGYNRPNKGLMDSCTRGFLSRVNRWKAAFPHLVPVPVETIEVEAPVVETVNDTDAD